MYSTVCWHPKVATNKEIRSKEDVMGVAKIYFSRWRIEEYFRCKKRTFQFENFRVRKLKAINALNFYITLCMAFLAHLDKKAETNELKVLLIKTANPLKEKVCFRYYRLAKRYLRRIVIRKRKHQALVSDESSEISSIMP